MNFVTFRKSGKNIYYKVNDKNPSIKNFKIFINLTELNTIINEIKDKSEKIVLFGSCAVGEDTMDSDIDLLILSKDKKYISDHLKKKQLSRKIQVVIVTAAEFIRLKEQDKAFYKEIAKGIKLWSGQDE